MFKNKNISRLMGIALILVICASLMASCQNVAKPTSSVNENTTVTTTVTNAIDATTAEVNVTTSATTVQSTTKTVQEKTTEKKTTEKKTSAKVQNKAPAKTTAKKASVKVPSPTAKVYKATTAKKAVTTTKKKVAATTKKSGLSDADILWAQKQANEYIKTLKGVTLDPSADGYTLSSGITIFKTKEELLKRLKDDINCDYESSLEADWHDIGMYVKMEKDEYGVWAYTIMNVCNG